MDPFVTCMCKNFGFVQLRCVISSVVREHLHIFEYCDYVCNCSCVNAYFRTVSQLTAVIQLCKKIGAAGATYKHESL